MGRCPLSPSGKSILRAHREICGRNNGDRLGRRDRRGDPKPLMDLGQTENEGMSRGEVLTRGITCSDGHPEGWPRRKDTC